MNGQKSVARVQMFLRKAQKRVFISHFRHQRGVVIIGK